MALRRLSVLSSHLHPAVAEHPSSNDERTGSNPLSSVSLVNCSDSHHSSRRRMDEPERRDCVFCMIIRGESPAFKLYEDDTFLCILDSQPLTHGKSLLLCTVFKCLLYQSGRTASQLRADPPFSYVEPSGNIYNFFNILGGIHRISSYVTAFAKYFGMQLDPTKETMLHSFGHSLIIPKSHFSSLATTPPHGVLRLEYKKWERYIDPGKDEFWKNLKSVMFQMKVVVAAMCAKVPFLSTAIMKATHCDSFNLLVNTGADAGQVIFHTHLHIIPRKAQDRLWTSKSIRRKPLKLNEDTIQLADCIREGLLPPQTNNCDACEDQRSKLAEST